jgi:hypothetical protein
MWRVQAIPQPPAGLSYHSTRCEGFLPQCPLRGYTITAPLFRGILKPPALRVIGAFPGRRAWGSRGVRMDARKRRDPIRMQHSHHHVIWILVVVWLLPISSFGPLQKTRHAPTLLSALDGDNRLTVPEVQTGSEPETPYVHEHRLTHTLSPQLHLTRSPGKEKSPLESMKTSGCQRSTGLARNTH